MKIQDLDKKYVTESRSTNTNEGFMDTALAGAAGRQLGRIGSKIASKVSHTAKGKVKHDNAVKSIFQSYKQWLGSTRTQPTVDSITNYLQELGFNPTDIKAATNSINEAMGPNQQKPLNRNQVFSVLSDVLTVAMQSGRVPAILKKTLPANQKPFKPGKQVRK
jgi:uncharacterized FAD-dependent dehydrogenase